MKDFKKQLKKEAEANTPDLYGEIMLSAEKEGLFPEKEEQTVYSGGAAAVRRGARPFIYAACAFVVALAIALGVVLPLTLRKDVLPESPFIDSVELSADDFYGVGALSSVRLLSDTVPNVKRAAAGAVESGIKEQITYFNRYLSAFDYFVGEGVIGTVVSDNSDPAYARYKKTITVNTLAPDGSGGSYVMYFNETLEEDDGEEQSFILEGVMTLDGEEYILYGERSVENDDKETEEELKIRAYTADRPANYVEMKQEISDEDGESETEYVYRIYSDNKLVEETAVEFETKTEKGKTRTEIEIEFRNGGGKGKYKIERELKGGVGEMSVKYSLNGDSGKFKIREVVKDGEPYYEYTFEDNSTQLIKK